jgi:multidrug resistance protein, MATE family
MKFSLPQGLRDEARANLRLAGPLIAAQITFMGMGVIDTMMAGRISGVALAAVAVGHAVWVIPFMGFLGVCAAISSIVAHRVGSGQAQAEIGAFARQSLVLAGVLGVLWLGLIRLTAQGVIAQLGLPEETAALSLRYLYAESTSAFAFCLCFAQRNFIEGQGYSRPILFTGLCGLAVKLVANLGFVHGRFGLPELGVVGCGWGTLAAASAMALVYAAQLSRLPRLRGMGVFGRGSWRPRSESLEVLRLGVPIAFILMAEAGLFGAGALLMARFGEVPVAAHQIALNFVSVVFMVPLGLGMATTVRVGHAAGAGLAAAVRLRGQAGMALGLCFALFSAALMGLKPEWITELYTQDPAIAPKAHTFLRFAALFQLFDCLQVTANGALRGIKDTRLPMVITLAAYWAIGMPVAAGLAFGAGMGPDGIWYGFIASLVAAAAGLSARFLSRTRQKTGSVVVP